jgi:hypothetical protein
MTPTAIPNICAVKPRSLFIEIAANEMFPRSKIAKADVYFGRAETILAERQRIKRATIANRRLQHQLQAA